MKLDENLFTEYVQKGEKRGSYKKKQLSTDALFDKVFDQIQTVLMKKGYRLGTDGNNLYVNSKIINKKLPGGRIITKKKFLQDESDYRDLIKGLESANIKSKLRNSVQGLQLDIIVEPESLNNIDIDKLKLMDKATRESLNESDEEEVSLNDKLEFLREYPTYYANHDKYYSRDCRISDLRLTDEQERKFWELMEKTNFLDNFWMENEELAQQISQEGRMGGHLIFTDLVSADPSDWEDINSFSDVLESCRSQYRQTKDYQLDIDEEEDAYNEATYLVNRAYDALIDFDNRVDQLIDLLKQSLDGYVMDDEEITESLKEESLKEALNDIKEIKYKLDLFPRQITINKELKDELIDLLHSRNISYMIDDHIDSNGESGDRYTFFLKFPKNESLKEDLSKEDKSEYGLTTMINSLIKDELEAIDGYNSAIVTLETEGVSDYTQVLLDIISEENKHIGQLQTILGNLNPKTTQDIEEGQQEGQEQIQDETINTDNNVL